jgi:CTP:molybdopterin cytidylyltransferase MocA
VTLRGLLLAAGAGTRMGGPKALVRDAAGEPWLVRGVRALREGGCDAVTVVLGAQAEAARPLLAGTGADWVLATDWADGMSASLRAGLSALTDTDQDTEAVVVSLVDLPDVHADVVRRVVARGADPAAVARAAYDGHPGHPVLLGRDHWAGVIASATGDRGARDYLATQAVDLVECGDLATGRDQDTP